MCDSIQLLVWLPPMGDVEYEACAFPSGIGPNSVTNDFRDIYATSPLTGAGYKITPIGETLPPHEPSLYNVRNRREFGRIEGYAVELNPPACSIGHNRLLANSTVASVDLGLRLLQYWLMTNGCTPRGLSASSVSKIVIASVTPTFLFMHESEDDARHSLSAFRSRSEALLNIGDGKPPAFSVPPEKPVGDVQYIYTSYVKTREFFIDAYVKVPDAAGSFCKPVNDRQAEWRIAELSRRTLRIGVKLNGKWLRENNLDSKERWLRTNWSSEPADDPYRKAFNLVRETLSLDQSFRTTQFRRTSIKALNLNKLDEKLVLWHVSGKEVREHDHFCGMLHLQKSKAYSACRLRVLQKAKIDFNIPFDIQRSTLNEALGALLQYPGDFDGGDLMEFIFSKAPAKRALAALTEMIASGVSSFAPPPRRAGPP